METSIDKLTAIQKEVGYEKGNINNIALLGLFGEAGEVLNECSFSDDPQSSMTNLMIETGIVSALNIDTKKKEIRDKKRPPLSITIKDEQKFDSEMADVLYYFNAIAINRGKTLDYYAELSLNKVMKYKIQKDIKHANISHGTK